MDWKILRFKKASLKKLKASFIATVFITFVVAFITTEGQSSVALIRQYDSKVEQVNDVIDNARKITDMQLLKQLIKDVAGISNKPGTDLEMIQEIRVIAGVMAVEAFTCMIPDMTGIVNALTAQSGVIAWYNFNLSMGIIISGFITIVVSAFVGNLIIVGKRRYYLDVLRDVPVENPIYSLFHVFRRDVYANNVRILFVRSLKLMLWSFTIVGGFVKCYEYRAIPYLLADNPHMDSTEAFRLSKELSRGYKWKMFVMDLSFLPLHIVQVLTLGIAGVFFVNPYYYGAQAQAYQFLCEAYKGETSVSQDAVAEFATAVELDGENFAESLGSAATEKMWAVYEKNDPKRYYDFKTMVLLFMCFSIIGFVWEVVLHIFQTGEFVKRGTLHGFWIPIYGVGGCLAILLVKKIADRPVKTFFTSMFVFGALEYLTSFALEMIHGVRWWDYTGYFMNINGRICLEGVLIFACAGCAVIYLGAPILGDLIDRIPNKKKTVLCIVFIIVFAADVVFSAIHPNTGKGITANGETISKYEANTQYYQEER